jgi:hypothetical protein
MTDGANQNGSHAILKNNNHPETDRPLTAQKCTINATMVTPATIIPPLHGRRTSQQELTVDGR